MTAGEAPVSGAYLQLLSVGLVWISVHCAGMCGPILVGLDVAGAARGVKAPRGALNVLLYQLGRSITYATMGAVAGLLGVGLDAVLGPVGGVFALAFGGSVLLWAYWPRRRQGQTRLDKRARGEATRGAQGQGLVDRIARALPRLLHPLAGPDGEASPLLVGAVMGLLPCMITLWALGIAATTQSPLHGAAIMVLLVAMTTPMLLAVTLLPRLLRGRGRRWLPNLLLTISGAWLVMVGLAGFEVLPHVHFNVAGYTLMLW